VSAGAPPPGPPRPGAYSRPGITARKLAASCLVSLGALFILLCLIGTAVFVNLATRARRDESAVRSLVTQAFSGADLVQPATYRRYVTEDAGRAVESFVDSIEARLGPFGPAVRAASSWTIELDRTDSVRVIGDAAFVRAVLTSTVIIGPKRARETRPADIVLTRTPAGWRINNVGWAQEPASLR
jgi:hypothetical protein